METVNSLEINEIIKQQQELVRALEAIERELDGVTTNQEIHLRVALRIAQRALFSTRTH
jgi:hypothetical protein